jgi:hypothetical protein
VVAFLHSEPKESVREAISMEPRKLLKKVGKGVGSVASTIVDVAGGAAEVAGNVVEKGISVMPGRGSAPKKGTRRATTRRSTTSKATSAPKAATKASATKASATKASATKKKAPTGKRTSQGSGG